MIVKVKSRKKESLHHLIGDKIKEKGLMYIDSETKKNIVLGDQEIYTAVSIVVAPHHGEEMLELAKQITSLYNSCVMIRRTPDSDEMFEKIKRLYAILGIQLPRGL